MTRCPFRSTRWHPAPRCLDLVYRRGGTALVRVARVRGHRAGGGLRMLVGQGARCVRAVVRVAPDREAMWEAVRDLG